MMNAMPAKGALGALRGSKFGAGKAPMTGFGAFPPMGAMPDQQSGVPPQGGMPAPGVQQQMPQLPPTGAAAPGMGFAGPGAMPVPGQGQQVDPMVLRSLAATMAGAGR